MKSIINLKNVDTTKQPLFFGADLNLQRYDRYKYKKLFDLFLQQLSFFWRPEEVDLGGKEKNDFLSLTDHEKFIFTKNLSYQTLLDSVQGRGVSHLLSDCSNPEFEAFTKAWEFFETIHSYSYTYIIKNVYANPSEVFDGILTDKEVLKRTSWGNMMNQWLCIGTFVTFMYRLVLLPSFIPFYLKRILRKKNVNR